MGGRLPLGKGPVINYTVDAEDGGVVEDVSIEHVEVDNGIVGLGNGDVVDGADATIDADVVGTSAHRELRDHRGRRCHQEVGQKLEKVGTGFAGDEADVSSDVAIIEEREAAPQGKEDASFSGSLVILGSSQSIQARLKLALVAKVDKMYCDAQKVQYSSMAFRVQNKKQGGHDNGR